MAAIHFPEPSTAPAPPSLLEMPPPDPAPKRFAAWKQKRIWIGIGALILVVAATVTWMVMTAPDPATTASVPSPDGFAELYLRTYLMDAGEGSEESVAPYLGYTPDLNGMVAGSWYVAGVAPIQVSQDGTTTTVLLAADLLGAVPGGYSERHTHFFSVMVEATETGLVAVGLPSEVAGPTPNTAEVERLALAPPPDTPITAAVADYLDWYLTGAAGSYEADRPNTAYRTAVIRGMSTPDLASQPTSVHVEVVATDNAGRTTILSYTLEVANQQGMWVASHP